ncbi:MAG: hypothetical protein J0I20_23530 [Chloroflexi bacterium]|nr:hypothetical protein [Chloroflexota bacterium]OJW04162.1 MAG: hypothetical protein BGO39_06700 [Chloroflexi bacterium 54-19]
MEKELQPNNSAPGVDTTKEPAQAAPAVPSPRAYSLLNPKKGAGLGCITLVAIFFIAVTSYGLAYQTRPSYTVDLGDRLDRPFVNGFEDREPSEKYRLDTANNWDGLSFRWSKTDSQVNFPGIGSQPVTVTIRYNTSNNPKNPALTVLTDDQNPVTLPKPPPGTWVEQSFLVPGEWFRDGDLHLRLKTDTFIPAKDIPKATDPRELGVAVDWVRVDPAELNKTAFIRPADGDFLPLVFTAVLGVLILGSIGVPAIWSLLSGVIIVGGLSYWLINDRLNLAALLEQDFIRILFFMWVVAYLAAELVPRLFRKLGVPTTRTEGAMLALLFLLQFVVLYFFQMHPQFIASDTGLNSHRLVSVIQGQWVFTEDLPSGKAAPYPPAFYFFLWPFTFLSGMQDHNLQNLIELVNSILTATGVFMVFYLASLLRLPTYHLAPRRESPSRLTPVPTVKTSSNWAAIIAAAFYAINRFQFMIFSQGNHANLFAVWTFMLFVCVISGTLDYLHHAGKLQGITLPATTRKAGAGAVTGSSTSPGRDDFSNPDDADDPYGLGHLVRPGGATNGGPSFLTRFFMRGAEYWNTQIGPSLFVALRYLLPVASLFLVFMSHYGTFLFTNVFMGVYILVLAVAGGKAGRRDVYYLVICWLVALILAFILYYYNFFGLMAGQVFGGVSSSEGPKPVFDLFATIRKIYTDSREWFGMIVLMAMVGGILLWVLRRGLGRAEILQKDLEQRWQLGPVGGALLAVGITGLLFALAENFQGVESRYQLYIIVPIVILAGRFLGRVWRVGWPGIVLVLALFGFQFLQSLLFWLARATSYFL